ncbi:hypothetical protein X798_02018, partial [Onchocerca flexuosa]
LRNRPLFFLSKIIIYFVFFWRSLPQSVSISISIINMSVLFQEIKSRQAEFMKAFNSGDAAGAAALYDPEGYFMPNGIDPVKGRSGICDQVWLSNIQSIAGIEQYYKQDMSEGVKSCQVITEEVNGAGDWAFERGSYHLNGARGPQSGAYLQIWKKVNGNWLIHNDCFNVIKPAKK